jgi:hypothetical protein
MLRLRPALVLLALLLVPAAGFAIEPAGSVVRLQGSATATMPTGFARPLFVGSTVLVGDRLETAAEARLQVRMNDGGVLTLGQMSSLLVEVYRRDPPDGVAALKALSGVFLMASGAIARLGNERLVIETPAAILGVRGTEVWGNVGLDGTTEVALLSGAGVTVQTPDGRVEMTAAGSGVTVAPGQVPPPPRPWAAARLAAAAEAVAFIGD